MKPLDEINLLVKASAVKPNAVNDEFRSLSRKNDETGSIVSWKADNENGEPFITPRIARRNIYRDMFKRVKGDKYSQEEADRIADEDYERALMDRYAALKKKYPDIPKFNRKENYTMVLPSQLGMPGEVNSYSMGSVDAKIPIKIMPESTDRNGSVLVSRNNRGSIPLRGKIEDYKLFRNTSIGKYVALHEGIHSFAQPEFSNYLNFLNTPEDSAYRDLWLYAAKPVEGIVGVGSEKARLRAEGHKPSEIANVWIKEMEDAIKKGWKPDKSKKTGSGWDLNVDSLKNIFYVAYNKAHGEGATDEDRRQYQNILLFLREAFPQAKNSRGGHSWYDFANVGQTAIA